MLPTDADPARLVAVKAVIADLIDANEWQEGQ